MLLLRLTCRNCLTCHRHRERRFHETSESTQRQVEKQRKADSKTYSSTSESIDIESDVGRAIVVTAKNGRRCARLVMCQRTARRAKHSDGGLDEMVSS